MEALQLERKIRRTEAARELGAGYGLPRLVTDQAQIALMLSSVATLPTLPAPCPIITDPSNPNFGKNKFILGISRLGGNDVMV